MNGNTGSTAIDNQTCKLKAALCRSVEFTSCNSHMKMLSRKYKASFDKCYYLCCCFKPIMSVRIQKAPFSTLINFCENLLFERKKEVYLEIRRMKDNLLSSWLIEPSLLSSPPHLFLLLKTAVNWKESIGNKNWKNCIFLNAVRTGRFKQGWIYDTKLYIPMFYFFQYF